METVLDDATNKTPGYKKIGAYSMIKGAFNVNSTSVKAWEALLRANRDLAVRYAEGGVSAAAGGSPFPSSTAPAAPGAGGAKPYWAGFSRITDAQISSLAAGIVDQVKLRGPFMSISDFVNHRVGYGNVLSGNPVDKDESYTVWFGPKAPEGHKGNWIQTIPGKSYLAILRLYGPLEPWFDKTWKPGDFELVE